MMNSVEPPPMSITRRCLPRGGLPVRDAEVDQARLLAAGDDLDVVAERGLGRHQEVLRIAQGAHRVGGDRADAVPGHVREALAEALERVDRAHHRVLAQSALAVEALGQAHVLLDAVDDAQLPQRGTRHHHVEAVGTDVDRGQQLALGHRCLGFRPGRARRVHRASFSSNSAWAE
jgi:hypothetical protein